MIILVQGFFFQNTYSLDIREFFRSQDIEKAAVCDMHYFSFSGILLPDEGKIPGLFKGEMTDYYGASTLYNGLLDDNTLKFTKRYSNDRNGEIFYSFTKNKEFWVGEYSGEGVGSGSANCIVYPVPADFMYPQQKLAPAD